MYFLNEEKAKLNILGKIVPILIVILIVLILFVYNQIMYTQSATQAIELDSDSLGTLQNTVFVEQQKRLQKEMEEAHKRRYTDLSREEVDKIKHIYAHREEKTVYLTFDDGPSDNITPVILDILKQYNIKATFFVLGRQAVRHPDIIKRQYNEGHTIENHTYSHSYKTVYTSKETFFDEFYRTQAAIQNSLGMEDFKTLVVRMPGGTAGGPYSKIKSQISSELYNKGIGSLDWNCLTKDAEGAETYEQVMGNVDLYTGNKTSVVLLMHDSDSKQITAETLPKVIEYYKEKGFKFETVENYLGRN